MVSVLRASYGYSDEYILSKSVRWVRNGYELCLKQKYDANLQLAQMVMHMYASAMSKEVQPPKTFGQMLKETRSKKEKSEEVWFADDQKLSSFGIRAKSSIAKEPKKQ